MKQTNTMLSLLAIFAIVSCSPPSGGGGGGQPTPPPEVWPKVYVGGQKAGMPGYWINGTWTPLVLSTTAGIAAMARSGTHIYGAIRDASGYWDNDSFQPMTTVNNNQSASTSIAVAGGTAYVGGYNVDNFATHVPRYWNGSWNKLPAGGTINGDGDGGNGGLVWCMAVDGSDVYAGGVVNATVGIAQPGYWKNGTWTGLPVTTSGQVYALIVSGSDVYAGGYNQGAGPFDAGYWLNGTWNSFEAEGTVKALVLDNGDVYAAGYWKNETETSIAGYWKNGDPHPLGTTDTSDVYSIAVLDGDVYVSASVMNEAGNAIETGYWKNSTWNKLSNELVKAPLLLIPEE